MVLKIFSWVVFVMIMIGIGALTTFARSYFAHDLVGEMLCDATVIGLIVTGCNGLVR